MVKDKTKFHMHVLAAQSYLVLGAAALIVIVARLQDKKLEGWFTALLFAGLIGISAHRVISILAKRISAMEKQSRQNCAEDAGAGKVE